MSPIASTLAIRETKVPYDSITQDTVDMLENFSCQIANITNVLHFTNNTNRNVPCSKSYTNNITEVLASYRHTFLIYNSGSAW